TTAQGLSGNSVQGVTVTSSGVIYSASFAGTGLSVSTNGGTSFSVFSTSQGLGSNSTLSVFSANDGQLIVGTGLGLSISNNNGISFTNYTTIDGLGANGIHSIFKELDKIWVCTNSGLAYSF
ncbi:MAG: hypothetical protein COW00_11765, partial [Bdellovibrio sp. CG12_big_fil_rev_8_21_14_0_65_39_13]